MGLSVRHFTRPAPSRREGNPKPRKRSGGNAWTALLLAAAWATLASAAPEGGDPDAAKLGVRLREVLLGRPDQVITCPGCPTQPALKVEVSSGQATELPLPYERLTQIAPFPDGKRLLAATAAEKGKRGLLLVLSAESLAPLGRVEIPGIGERIAIAPSGYVAYVLCRRPGRGRAEDPETGEWALLTVDLGASKVAETYPLSTPASDLALAPDGGRLFVALKDRLQTFTTAPLTASWYYRSPGSNRRIFVRPRRGEIYALREKIIAVFPPQPAAAPAAEGGGEKTDDAAWVLEPPVHVERLGFSADGRMAVAAGLGFNAMLVLDAEKRQFVGTWPEEAAAIGTYLDLLASRDRPRGPRGRLAGSPSGFAPPLQPIPQPPPAQSSPSARSAQSGSTGGAAQPEGKGIGVEGAAESPPRPSGDSAAQGTASNPPLSPPGPEPAKTSAPPPVRGPSAATEPAGTDIRVGGPPAPTPSRDTPAAERTGSGTIQKPPGTVSPETAPSSTTGQALPASTGLEEVVDPVLSGRILGQAGLVASVILFGPDSLLTIRAQVAPAADGTYSFSLPPRGRYRIVLLGAPGTTLSCKPPFQTVVVAEYGFRGLDFNVLGAVGGAPKRPEPSKGN